VATTAHKDFPVFDSDSHVVEPPSMAVKERVEKYEPAIRPW
jgi:hypothetical protein